MAACGLASAAGLRSGEIRDGALKLYGEREGFGGSYVVSLFEDSHGVVWASTLRGLYQLDGDRWAKVTPDIGVEDSSVLTVFEDDRGSVWAGGVKAVYRRRPGEPRFEKIEALTLGSSVSQSFSEDQSGTVWISDMHEGFRIPGRPSRPSPERRGFGVKLLHDRRGNFWVGTHGQGLWRVRVSPGESSPRVEVITARDGLASDAIPSLLEDREGNVWLGTLAGLQRLTPRRVTPVRDLPVPRGVAETPDGSIWVATASGLVRFKAGVRRDYTEADGLQGSIVLALHTDDRGDLWISTERGLSRLSGDRFSPILARPDPHIQRILAMTSRGRTLWLRDFHLRLLRFRDGELTVPEDSPDTVPLGALSVLSDSRGDLWIGGARGRLGVRLASGGVRAYNLDIGDVVQLFEDAAGDIWAGGDEGLSRLSGERIATLTKQHDFPGGVKAILRGSGRSHLAWSGARPDPARPGGRGRCRGRSAASRQVSRLHDRGRRCRRGVRRRISPGAASQGWSALVRDNLRPHNRRSREKSASRCRPRACTWKRCEPTRAASSPWRALRLPARTSHLADRIHRGGAVGSTHVSFRYRLEGFDRDWIDAGRPRARRPIRTCRRASTRFASCQRADGDGWSESSATLRFSIEPTFYQTGWFYVAAAMLTFSRSWYRRVAECTTDRFDASSHSCSPSASG